MPLNYIHLPQARRLLALLYIHKKSCCMALSRRVTYDWQELFTNPQLLQNIPPNYHELY